MNQRVSSLLLAFFALTAQAQLPTIEKNLHQEGDKPFFYTVAVPDGNYKVTVTLGRAKSDAETTVRAEGRRLFVEPVKTKKGKYAIHTFTVNKRTINLPDGRQIKINAREKAYKNWDDSLSLEFNGSYPAVRSVKIEPAGKVTQLILCGNSTVTDQNYEPYASWGQMVTRWFDPSVAVVNLAESGQTCGSTIAQRRLDKAVSMLQEGDWLFVEFGHNDQKDKKPGSGAWYNFTHYLKQFVDLARQKKANIVFCTPTQRRKWEKDNLHIRETHGDYPEAMRAVAKREGVPVIELHDMTRTFFETLGYEDSKKSLVHYPANTFPGQTKELADDTHFNPYGAYEVSKMVVMGMKQIGCSLTEHLLPDWKDFDPAHPDSFDSFQWPASPTVDTSQPAGN